jgi:uncharacterized OsmC-like protein
MTAPLSYTVHALGVSGGPAAVDAAGASIPLDTGWGGEPTGAPGPAELLAAAFSACLLKNLDRAGHLLDFHYERAEVTVTARRQDAPPMFVEIVYEMTIVTAEPERRIDLIHTNLRNFGTVYNTLAAVCEVRGTVERAEPSTSGS